MATEILRPNAAGDETNIPHAVGPGQHWYLLGDESDSTYVYNTTQDYKRDLYNLSAPTGSGTINSVTVRVRVSSTVSVGRVKGSVKINGTVYESDYSFIESETWYSYSMLYYETNPDTGEPWTWEDLADLQAGVSLWHYGDGHARCSEVYVEVDYTPPPITTIDAPLIEITSEAKVPTLVRDRIFDAPLIEVSGAVLTPTLSLGMTVSPPLIEVVTEVLVLGGTVVYAPLIEVTSEALIPTLVRDTIFDAPLIALDAAVLTPVVGWGLTIIVPLIEIDAQALIPTLHIDGRALRVYVITTQYRQVKPITTQYRKVKAITSWR